MMSGVAPVRRGRGPDLRSPATVGRPHVADARVGGVAPTYDGVGGVAPTYWRETWAIQSCRL